MQMQVRVGVGDLESSGIDDLLGPLFFFQLVLNHALLEVNIYQA